MVLVDRICEVGAHTGQTRALLLVGAMKLLAGLTRSRMSQSLVDGRRSSTWEGLRGGSRSLSVGVLSLAGHLIDRVGLECVLLGSSSRRVCLCMELGYGVIADLDTGSVLLTLVSLQVKM